jgi:hypothetical protein
MEDDQLLVANQDNNPFLPFVEKAETNPSESKEKVPSNGQTTPFMFSFLTDLVYCIKDTLISINNYLFLPIEKLSDAEFRAHSQSGVREDIKKIDLILNSLLNYININTPIIKTNTMYVILEEILEANEKQVDDKKIKIFKDCEKDLPETVMHNEHVRFILNSLIQYSIVSTSADGSIRFLMKYRASQKEPLDKKTLPDGNGDGGYIVFVISFTANKKLAKPFENGNQKEEPVNLILKLVNESIQKNHGAMKIETEEKPPRIHITLKLNIERRKAVYYEPIKF